MKTLTLFNAFAIACQQLHEVCVRLSDGVGWMPTDDLLALNRFGMRRARQIATLRPAIRARLTPPATQHIANGDYAGDLVNDSEGGRIDQDDIRSLASAG